MNFKYQFFIFNYLNFVIKKKDDKLLDNNDNYTSFFTFWRHHVYITFLQLNLIILRYYKLNTLRSKSQDIPDDKLITTRYSNLRVNKDIDTIIIGSGIGGLQQVYASTNR